MWPVHTWLPDAHVEAPTAGSVILAGVLLKMGGYGFLRFSLPMLPEASIIFAPLIFALSIIAVIYTSLVALAQEDMKKLIAYSSVAHMGFVTVGIFTLTVAGHRGRDLPDAEPRHRLGRALPRRRRRLRPHALAARSPAMAASSTACRSMRFVFMLFMLASVGLPGTSGFVGEFLVMVGAFQANAWVAALAATGMILGAAYMLWLYRRVIFGELTKDSAEGASSTSARARSRCSRRWSLLVLWMGIYPEPFLDVMHASVDNLVERLELARAALDASALAAR